MKAFNQISSSSLVKKKNPKSKKGASRGVGDRLNRKKKPRGQDNTLEGSSPLRRDGCT